MANKDEKKLAEKEFFAMEKTGRDGLDEMVLKMGQRLWNTRANYLNIDKDIYFQRAVLNIANDDLLKPLLKTRKGLFSIYCELSKAVQLGLNIGGQIPQAYLVNFGSTASLIPTAEGYKFIAVAHPAVLQDFDIVCVYDGDTVSIPRTGPVKHEMIITENKRKLIGIYCTITKLDGKSYNDFMSRGDIEDIRDKWSKQKSGKAWSNSFEMMALKTATKRFLKPYAALKEGLTNMISMDDEYDDIQDNYQPEDIGSRFDDAVQEEKDPPEPSKTKDVTPKTEPKKPVEEKTPTESDELDIF